MERIAKRDRPEEKSIPRDYIEKIHARHEEWIQGQERKKVLVIDGDQDFVGRPDLLQPVLQGIAAAIAAVTPRSEQVPMGQSPGGEPASLASRPAVPSVPASGAATG